MNRLYYNVPIYDRITHYIRQQYSLYNNQYTITIQTSESESESESELNHSTVYYGNSDQDRFYDRGDPTFHMLTFDDIISQHRTITIHIVTNEAAKSMQHEHIRTTYGDSLRYIANIITHVGSVVYWPTHMLILNNTLHLMRL